MVKRMWHMMEQVGGNVLWLLKGYREVQRSVLFVTGRDTEYESILGKQQDQIT